MLCQYKNDTYLFYYAMYETLSQLGLTSKEIDVFVKLYSYNTSPASLIAEKTNMSRTHVYELLQSLVEKWVCTRIKKWGTTFFQVISSEQLKNLADQRYHQLQWILDQLQTLQSFSKSWFDVEYFVGVAGLKSLYNNLLARPWDHLYNFLWTDTMDQDFREYLYESFLPQRLAKEIRVQAILPYSEENKRFAANPKKVPLTKAIMINDPIFDFASEIILYDDRKILISLLSPQEMAGIKIVSEGLYRSLKSIFLMLWKYSRNVS